MWAPTAAIVCVRFFSLFPFFCDFHRAHLTFRMASNSHTHTHTRNLIYVNYASELLFSICSDNISVVDEDDGDVDAIPNAIQWQIAFDEGTIDGTNDYNTILQTEYTSCCRRPHTLSLCCVDTVWQLAPKWSLLQMLHHFSAFFLSSPL